jgi:3-deoxy-manno-octulosonate cytidylyltransferase (CMP-KDO synthetase)
MIIIPARIESSRFFKKVLCDIGGLPMVIRTAKQVEHLDDVVIATDSNEVIDIAKQYGFKAVLTSSTHKSGTDRINEASNLLGLKDDDIIINLQADEPFIELDVVQLVQKRLKQLQKKQNDFIMVSCYNSVNEKTAQDPNLVKVTIDNNQNAIYFSRSPIPYNRNGNASYFGHIGIYGFTKKSLHTFCSLNDAPIEDIEKLEQLRAVYHAKAISMVKVSSTSFGIDTKEDLDRAIKIFL